VSGCGSCCVGLSILNRPAGCGYICCVFQAGGSSALLMDLAANEKSVHADFLNGMYCILIVRNLTSLNELS